MRIKPWVVIYKGLAGKWVEWRRYWFRENAELEILASFQEPWDTLFEATVIHRKYLRRYTDDRRI